MTLRIPHQRAYDRHDDHLVEIEPALHEHRAERLHYVLVIQSAHGSHKGRRRHAPYPPVAPEVYILLLSGPAHEEYGRKGDQDADPLTDIEPFTEDQHRSDQHDDRSGRIDRPDDGQRQVLKTEIAAYPRRQHDERFQHHQQVCAQLRAAGGKLADTQRVAESSCRQRGARGLAKLLSVNVLGVSELGASARGCVEEGACEPAEAADVVQQEWGEYQCREDCVQEEDRENGVVLQGCFLGCVIEPEKGCRYECECQPHG